MIVGYNIKGMERTDHLESSENYTRGIELCLNEVRKEDPTVGVYLEHAPHPKRRDAYIVYVDNGQLTVPVDIARCMDSDPGMIHEHSIDRITYSFKRR